MKTLSPLIKRLYWSQGTSVVRPSSVAYDVNAQIKVRMSKEMKFMLFCCSEQSKKRTFDHFEDEIWIRINLPLLYEDPLPRMSCLHGHGFSANGDMVIDRIDQFRRWIHFPSKAPVSSMHGVGTIPTTAAGSMRGTKEQGSVGRYKRNIASEESCPKHRAQTRVIVQKPDIITTTQILRYA